MNMASTVLTAGEDAAQPPQDDTDAPPVIITPPVESDPVNPEESVQVSITQAQIDQAQKEGSAILLDMDALAVTTDHETAPVVTVNMPANATAKVEIPVHQITSGTVAILINSDGTERVLKNSVPTENGLVVTLSAGDRVKIVDNHKAFSDVGNHYWGTEYINFVSARELFEGMGDGTFAPQADMSRGMIVTVLARYSGVDTSASEPWYEVGRQWAMEQGVSDGEAMESNLTREQLATMLYRYIGSPAVSGVITGFTDADGISDWASDAMLWAVQQGILVGDNGKLSPRDDATRAEVATMLTRFVTLSVMAG